MLIKKTRCGSPVSTSGAKARNHLGRLITAAKALRHPKGAACTFPSGARHKEFLILFGFGLGDRVAGDVLHEFAAAFRAFALDHAHAGLG